MSESESKPQNDLVTRLRERYDVDKRYADEMALEEHDYCASGCPDRQAAQIMEESEIYREAADEIDKLRRVCAEAYQWAGALVFEYEGDFGVELLDNLSDAAAGVPLRHETILPCVLPEDKQRAILES